MKQKRAPELLRAEWVRVGTAAVVLSFEFLVEFDPHPRPLRTLGRLDWVAQFIFLNKSSVADGPYRASLCPAHQGAHVDLRHHPDNKTVAGPAAVCGRDAVLTHLAAIAAATFRSKLETKQQTRCLLVSACLVRPKLN